MHAHIAHDTVSILLESPPPTFMWQSVIGPQGCRPGPHFIIEKIRHRFERGIAVGTHMKVTAHIHVANFPEQAAFDDLLFHINEMRRALSLRADLYYALEFAGGVEHGCA